MPPDEENSGDREQEDRLRLRAESKHQNGHATELSDQ